MAQFEPSILTTLLLSLVFVVMVAIIYVRTLWQKREASFSKQLELQQKTLDISFWATGDTVVESDLRLQQTRCLNQNSDFPIDYTIPHFFDDAFLDRINKDDRAYVRSRYESIINGGHHSFELSYRIDGVEQSTIWVVEKGVVLERNSNDKALHVISNFRDVTSLKQEQNRLEQLANELERRLNWPKPRN